MTVSDTAQFTMENVAAGLKAGIAAVIEGVETSMIDIATIAAAAAPTDAPAGNATATTVAPTDAPTQASTAAVTAAPTPAPEENATVAPTPAPQRRLASGDMTVTASFTDVPDTVTKEIIEAKASEIQTAINSELSGQGITISGFSVMTDIPAPTPAPTPAPFLAPTPSPDVGTSGAFGVRLHVSAAAMLLALLCRGHA